MEAVLLRLLLPLTLLASPASGQGLASALPAAVVQAPAAALLESAQQTARLIEDPDAAGPAWAEIAAAQALSGDVVGARKLIGRVGDDSWKAEILKAVAQAQVSRGDIAGALATCEGIGEDDAKAEALLEIAVAQVRAGAMARARQTLAAAKAALVSDYLGGLAPRLTFVRAAVGDLAGAQRAAASVSGDSDRALVACELVAGLAAGGETKAALSRLAALQKQVAALPEGPSKSRVQVRLVVALSAAGEAKEALATAAGIGDARHRTDAYIEAATLWSEPGSSKTMALARDAFQRAWSSAEGILQPITRVVAWCRIGQLASRCGEDDDALELLRKAREAAETQSDPRDRVRALAAVVRATPPAMLASLAPRAARVPLAASFRALVAAGLRAPRPTLSLGSGEGRPRALVAAARSLLAQVLPLASGSGDDGKKAKADALAAIEALEGELDRKDESAIEKRLATLLGTTTDPGGLLRELMQRFSLETGEADSLEEEQSLNAFLIAQDLLTAVRTLLHAPKSPTPRQRVAAAALDLRLAMNGVLLGPAERESVFLALPSGKISLADVLARAESPEDSGSPGRLAALLSQVAQALSEDAALPERVRHPRILLALGQLSERAQAAAEPK